MILRRIMLLFISLLIPFCAFAGGTHEDYSRDLYFAPYLGSANINLNTPDMTSNGNYEKRWKIIIWHFLQEDACRQMTIFRLS